MPLADAGVASGTNGAVRELGGVIGVAVLGAVFTRAGAYGSAKGFVDGFGSALWLGAGLSIAGAAAAGLSPGARHADATVALPTPAFDD